MNNDGETIDTEEDRNLCDDFRDREAKEEDRLALVNAREQARQFNKDHGDFPESDPDDDYSCFWAKMETVKLIKLRREK